MYDEYFIPIPDAGRYLARIGIKDKKEPSLSFLNELIDAHQLSVPFENIDSCLLKKPVSIVPADLYEKIVIRKRGGYCFELNGLFYELLSSLGFNVYPCFCNVIGGGDADAHSLLMHRGTIVIFDDGEYFCDVGFGGAMPREAVPLKRTAPENDNGFFFLPYKDRWFRLCRVTSSGGCETVLRVHFDEQDKVDFIPANFYGYTSPDCPFTYKLMVNLRTPDGHVSITNDIFTLQDRSGTHKEQIKDEAALRGLLAKHFGISY